jgi:flagella basal body P-ring formation protein FlgA
MDIRSLWCSGLGFFIAALCFSQVVKAEERPIYQSLDAIQDAAVTYVQETLENPNYELIVEPGKMDERLQLKACDGELKAFIPNAMNPSNKISVGIACEGTERWTLYVPVFVKKMAQVVTINHNVTRNAILSAEDLEIRPMDISGITRGYYTSPKEIVGMAVKKSLRFGEVVTPLHLQSPTLVKKGSQVKILSKGSGVIVTAAGLALKDGAKGEWIQVRNISSSRVIEGMVLADGSIEVPLVKH